MNIMISKSNKWVNIMKSLEYETNYYRRLIVGSETKIPLYNGRYVTAINFDNAATTPPFVSVMHEINNFAPWYSSIHRGTGYKSMLSSNIYENSREIIKDFVKADKEDSTVIFIKNTTEAINKLAYRLNEPRRKNVVLSTCMEHHSNDLPWRNKFKVDYIELDETGRLSLDSLEHKLKKYRGAVGLVAVSGASNVTGYKNPVYKIASIAHKYNAKILVDGAQLIPHSPFDMKPLNTPEHIDYVVFSAHKMYAPFGIGVLIGPKSTFEKGAPEYKGGGTVDLVTHDFIRWANPPNKEEAGSPNILGVVALSAAVKMLSELGMENVEAYEHKLLDYSLQKLRSVPHVKLWGDKGDRNDLQDHVAIITFNIKGMPHDMVASILSYEGGIAVRNGCFCAQPYVQRLLRLSDDDIKNRIQDPSMYHPGMVRISFGIYNNKNEVDILIRLLHHIVKNKESYIEKYRNISIPQL